MKKAFLCLFFAMGGGITVLAQPDSSPLKVKDFTSAGNYAGGVDKSKVMDLFQDQQYDEALNYLSPVLKNDSDNVPVLNYAGYAYYMSDNEPAAEACYKRILQVDAHSVTALHYLVLMEQTIDPSSALGYALQLVALQPNKAMWWRISGELFGRKQQPDSALAYLSWAYEIAPNDVKTVVSLGNLLCDGKAYSKADSIADIALAKDSMNVSLLKLRVRSAFWQKQYEQVLDPGEKLLKLNEPSTNSLEWLVLSYYNLKRYDECVRVCEGMFDMGLDIEAVYYYEGRAQAKLHNYAASDYLLRIALKKAINITAEWYYDALGDNYEATHDYKKAVAHYDTAFYLFHDPLALYNCGRIAEAELHNNALARKYYQRYLTLAKPESEEEKKAYRYVKGRWGRK